MPFEEWKLAKLENLALDWVNEKFDMEISAFPPGQVSSVMECPIARALNSNREGTWRVDLIGSGYNPDAPNTLAVEWFGAHADDLLGSYTAPDEVRLFVEMFDNGYYPGLIEKGE